MSGFNNLFRKPNPLGWRSDGKNGAMLSSCWAGKNASKRMMNVLSPHMPQATFEGYVKWQLARGCNAVHPILCNQGDGEFAGYSPYGARWTGSVDAKWCELARARMMQMRSYGLAVVVWIMTDDSPDFNRRSEAELRGLYSACAGEGLFDQAALVVMGLEINEYMDARKVASLVEPLRASCGKPIGQHQTSDRIDMAALSDVFFWQTNPGKKPAQIKQLVSRVVNAIGGKPVVAFELARTESRPLAQAALEAGAIGVGNW